MAALTHRMALISRSSPHLPFSHSLRPPRQERLHVVRAGDQKDVANTDAEDRLEQLEASLRGKKASAPPRRVIPIKGVNQPNQKEESNSNMAPWKEGQLFPEGWDSMPLGQKVKLTGTHSPGRKAACESATCTWRALPPVCMHAHWRALCTLDGICTSARTRCLMPIRYSVSVLCCLPAHFAAEAIFNIGQ